MAKFCGKCGSALNDTAVFCGGCGTKVSTASPVASAPMQTAWAPVASPAPASTPGASAFTPVQGGFAPVSPTTAPVQSDAPVQTAWAPVASSFDSAPATSTPDNAAFSPVAGSYAPMGSTPPAPASTPAPEAGAFTPVQASFTPVPPTTPVQSYAPAQPAWAPVASSFDLAPATPTPDNAAFSPVAGSYAPIGSTSPAPVSMPTPQAGAFTPVQGGGTPVPQTPAPVQTYAPSQPYTPAQPYTPPQPAYAPIPASYTPTPGVSTVGTAYPAAGGKKSNTVLKIIVALVLLIFVGGALALGGLWYAAQKINAKARSATAKALAGNGPGSAGMNEFLKGVSDLKGDSSRDGSAAGVQGDPCRFLSKAEVSNAVGIQVIRVEAKDGGCSYIAKGDPADVTSKHMASMVGGLSGADAKTQKTIQQLAGGLFAQQEATDKDLRAQAATGEIPVLVVSFTSGNAQAEMKMNRGAFNYVTGGQGSAASSGSGNLDGIGDEAYVAGGSMLIFRKGNSVAHFMYTSCPCNTDNIKPLAKLVASRM